ncbi:MAG: helix-turn-helix domain-containing protein [Dehalococcoidia bacterium]|nr:helix-turn-helix domain-containing protein [Dehalococcoidia bacterium]
MNGAGFSKRQQSHEGRSRLLWAALRVFEREGFEGATVDAICREAGYSKGGFYFHFCSKDALIDELLRRTPADHLFGTGRRSLLTQLWAETRREPVRKWLVTHYSRRLAQLQKGMRTRGYHDADALARLLLTLETGLQVQCQMMASAPGRRQIQRALNDLIPEKTAATAAA